MSMELSPTLERNTVFTCTPASRGDEVGSWKEGAEEGGVGGADEAGVGVLTKVG